MASNYDPHLRTVLKEASIILKDSNLIITLQNYFIQYNISRDTPSWDICCFLISLELKNKTDQYDKWLSWWAKNSKDRRYHNFKYSPPGSYLIFYSYSDVKLLFIKWLSIFSHPVHKNDWKLYFTLFYNIYSRIKPVLSKLEFKTFLAILKKQSVEISDLSSELLMAKSNISKYIKKIKDKKVIFVGTTFNLKMLKLAYFIITISYSMSYEINVEKMLDAIKPYDAYFRGIYRNIVGVNTSLINFLMPEDINTEELAKKIESFVGKRTRIYNIDIWKMERIKRIRSFNYTNYKFKEGKWAIYPTDIQYALLINCKNNVKKGKEKINTKTENGTTEDISVCYEQTNLIIDDFQIKKQDLNLNKESIDLLNFLYRHPYASIANIMEKTGLSETKAKKLLKMYFDKNLLKKRIAPLPIFGLVTIIMLLDIDDDKEQLKIHQMLAIFPEVYSEKIVNLKNKRNYLMVTFRLPEQILMSAIDEINKKFTGKIRDLFIIAKMFSKSQPLPFDKFDTLFKKWRM